MRGSGLGPEELLVYQLIENAQNNVTPLRFLAPVWDGRLRIVPKRRSDDAACPAAARSELRLVLHCACRK